MQFVQFTKATFYMHNINFFFYGSCCMRRAWQSLCAAAQSWTAFEETFWRNKHQGVTSDSALIFGRVPSRGEHRDYLKLLELNRGFIFVHNSCLSTLLQEMAFIVGCLCTVLLTADGSCRGKVPYLRTLRNVTERKEEKIFFLPGICLR